MLTVCVHATNARTEQTHSNNSHHIASVTALQARQQHGSQPTAGRTSGGDVSGPLCAQTPPTGKVLSEDDYESSEWAVLIKL
jgi:hypothetical protein